MSIKESLIKNYKKAGGSDPSVMESTSRLIENTGSSGSGDGGGGIFVINTISDDNVATMDKTFAEIQTAMLSMPVVVNGSGRLAIVANVQDDDRYKTVHVVVPGITGNTVNWSALAFTTGSASGYPSMSF